MNQMKFFFSILFCSVFTSLLAQNPVVLKPSETQALVTFIITDYDSIPEANAKLNITSVDGSFKNEGISNVDGKCDMLLPEGKQYKMSVQKFSVVFNFDGMLTIPSEPGSILFDQSLKIRVVKKYKRVYRLENVYFDNNKTDIRKESEPSLNTLYKALQDHPTMKIEIAGHTDDLGDDASNMRLSQKRADAVVQYLVSKGIAPGRLIAKGYGERLPESSNATEEGRSRNRRTEVKVIEE
jgi:OOP family OmpA-OmpF porin